MESAGGANAPRATLRVLCLHGFRTNARVMQDQVRALRKTLGADTEFVFLNGPFEANGAAFPDIEQHYSDARPFYEWMQYFVADTGEPTELSAADVARIRERPGVDQDWALRYGGIEQALVYMHTQLQALGPFDVAIGFSQGGLMLTIFAMWCLEKHSMRFWKLAVLANTSRIHGVNLKPLFVTPDGKDIRVPFPSVHLIGKRDPIRSESLKMVSMYDKYLQSLPTRSRLVLEHEEGHRFPSYKQHQEFYATLATVMNAYRSTKPATQAEAVVGGVATVSKL